MIKKTLLSATALSIGVLASGALPAMAQEKTDFKLAWSIYVGWMPWGYLEDSGIMDKWADKYGITVDIVQINDYVESINQYTAGEFDGVSATNMDTLSIPSGGGVDTTALIIGDYSNGNDAVILKGEGTLADLAGKKKFPAKYRNTCWSLVATDDGVKVGANYEATEEKIAKTDGFISQNGEDAALRKQTFEESVGWYAGITSDMFG